MGSRCVWRDQVKVVDCANGSINCMYSDLQFELGPSLCLAVAFPILLALPLPSTSSRRSKTCSRTTPSLLRSTPPRISPACSMTTTTADSPPSKRAKTSDAPSSIIDTAEALPFHPTLLEPANIARLRAEHDQSVPYHHAVVNELFEPDFLKKARQEIVEQISFREKETDICEWCSFLLRDQGRGWRIASWCSIRTQ